MSISYVPVGYTVPSMPNDAGSGTQLGLMIRCHEDTAIDRIRTPLASATIARAKIYSVSGGGGGDGTVKADLINHVTTAGGDLVLDSPLTLVHDIAYLVMVMFTTPQVWGGVTSGGVPIDQDPFYTVNEWWGVFNISATMPTTATITTGQTLGAPFENIQTYYGVGLGYSSLPSKVEFAVSRYSDSEAAVAFRLPGDAPEGVTITRCPGSHMGNDGMGRPPSDPAYDPSTIPGTFVVAEGVMTSPYIDASAAAGVSTYWVARTAAP